MNKKVPAKPTSVISLHDIENPNLDANFKSLHEIPKEKIALITDDDKTCALPEVDPPQGLNINLFPYQKQALGWMLNREQEKNPCGGILGVK